MNTKAKYLGEGMDAFSNIRVPLQNGKVYSLNISSEGCLIPTATIRRGKKAIAKIPFIPSEWTFEERR